MECIKQKTLRFLQILTSQKSQRKNNAADRNRTGTGITTHGILSPGRLPVPPLRHVILFKKQKMGPTGLEPVTLCL